MTAQHENNISFVDKIHERHEQIPSKARSKNGPVTLTMHPPLTTVWNATEKHRDEKP